MTHDERTPRVIVPFHDEDVAIAESVARKMDACDTSAPWSIDLDEEEFKFILGIMLAVAQHVGVTLDENVDATGRHICKRGV